MKVRWWWFVPVALLAAVHAAIFGLAAAVLVDHFKAFGPMSG